MASSSTNEKIPLENQSVEPASDDNSMKTTPIQSVEEENLTISLKGQTSIYRGVNKARRKEDLYSAFAYVRKKGRSVYLGRYDSEEEAARAHDIVTLKSSGSKARLNFPASDYDDIMRTVIDMSDEELVAQIRRSSSRFARGCSKYRGVASNPESSRWYAHKAKKKEGHFLGTFGTEEEAAMAYDIETIKVKGWNAQTNFNLSLYDVEGIQVGTKNLDITEDTAKYFKQATVLMPLGEMQQNAYSRYMLASNYPSDGFGYVVPRIDPSYHSLSLTIMTLLSEHPNFQVSDMADSSGNQETIGSVNRFSHSRSSRFEPYNRN